MYDLIGDIHGYAKHLQSLLDKLGYRQRDGVWSHPERQVIFLGDFIDRGPWQLDSVRIARAMVENGQALAVMGNHEFNAVAYATPDPDQRGEFLRPHNAKNVKQHAAFIQAVTEASAQHRDIINWFRSLPLHLDLPGLRVIHACWHEPSLAALAPYLDEHGRLNPEGWLVTCRAGHVAYDAVEVLLKGFEVDLPDGLHFLDKDKHKRTRIRSRWWQPEAKTYRDAAIVAPHVLASIPEKPLPANLLPGYD